MDMPKNEDPEVVSTFFGTIFGLFSSYGWHLLFAAITANLIWSQIRPKILKWQQRRLEQQREAEYNQNPERLIQLQEALERSRLRMQEEHDRKVREYAEKQKKIEEEKRQEKIKKWECTQKGCSSGPVNEEPSPSPDASMRPPPSSRNERLRGREYNPLSGGGGASGFRPSRSFGGFGGG